MTSSIKGLSENYHGPRPERGFAMIVTLIFLLLMMLFLSALLSTSQQAAIHTADSVAAARVRSSALSGIDYAETQLRARDFTETLKGLNGVPDVVPAIARQLAFRNPMSRTAALETDWNGLAYGESDDGLFHDDRSVLNRPGLPLNRCKLFFKVTNNPDDPGGPFEDTDDTILVRAVSVTPAPASFLGLRSIRNLCEIIETQFRRTTAFLGPSAVFCPAGRLQIDITEGGMVRGLAETASGAAIATGESPPQITTAFPEQLEGNPAVLDLASSIRSDARLRWLTDDAFVTHWKTRIGEYATQSDWQSGNPMLRWAPAGIEISEQTTLQGLIFAAGPVALRQSARIEGLLVLVDSASLVMSDSASVRGAITAVGKDQAFRVILKDQSQIQYRPALVREALRLLPLSRTRFRYIPQEM